MDSTSYSIQMSYMIDTDEPRFRAVMASMSGGNQERMVNASIEHARRMSGQSAPRGVGAGANWKPIRSFGCCDHADAGKLFDHCKGAEHVAAEYGLAPGSHDAVAELGGLLSRVRLAGKLPFDLNELGLRGAIEGALNESWRRLYRNSDSNPFECQFSARADAISSSDDVFAKRVSNRSSLRMSAPSSGPSFSPPRPSPFR